MLDELHKKAKAAIEPALEPGETVQATIVGEKGWALVATDRRVFITKWGNLSGALFGQQVNSWHYAQISGIEDKVQMTSRALVLQVPGANPIKKFGRMDTGDDSVWHAPNALMVDKKDPKVAEGIATVRRLIGDHQRPQHLVTAPTPAAEPDVTDRIRRLAQLRDEGLLSEDEFQAKKMQLLGL